MWELNEAFAESREEGGIENGVKKFLKIKNVKMWIEKKTSISSYINIVTVK